MARLDGLLSARVLRGLIEYPDDESIRLLFLLALLELPRIPGIQVAPEEHGVMQALGVYRSDDWCYSIKPTKGWLKVWLRPPELKLHPDSAQLFKAAFVETEQPESGAITARIVSESELSRLVDIISAPKL